MNIKTVLGLAVVAGLLVVAAPADRAQALSLINPAATTAAQQASGGVATEVRWHGHRGWHRHHGWRRHHGWHHRHHGWRHRHHRHWR